MIIFLSYTLFSFVTEKPIIPLTNWETDTQSLQLAEYHPGPKFFNFSSGGIGTEYVIVSTYNSHDNWSAGSVTQFGIYVFKINSTSDKSISTATLTGFDTNFSAYPIIQVMKGVYSATSLYYPISLTSPLQSGVYNVNLTFKINQIVQIGPYHFQRNSVRVYQNITIDVTH